LEISRQDKPSFIIGQYTDDIGKYRLYYNPLGFAGVSIADRRTQNLINLCSGTQTVKQIIQFDGRSEAAVMEDIKDLADQEIIKISDQYSKEIRQSHKRRGTLACWLHITNNCNLACSYCYIHKYPGEMSLETGKLTILKMVESCINNNMDGIEIKFAGGEPLLRFNFIKELVDYSQQFKDQVNVKYSIVTNGTLVTQKIAEYLKRYNVGIGASMDGIGSVNDYSRFDRNGNGSFTNVVKGLKILKDAGNRIGVMTTISKSNYENLLELTKFLIDGDYGFRFSMEKDCESGWPELLNHNSELIYYLNQCYDYIEENLPSRNFFYVHKFGDVSFTRPVNRCCSAGDSFLAVGHDGKVGICGMGLAKPFSKIDDLDDIIKGIRECNPELKSGIASDYPLCNKCTWRTSCASGCPLQTKSTYGTYSKPTPYCIVHKAILPRILHIKGLQIIRDNGLST
jgi:uncharacterized protein